MLITSNFHYFELNYSENCITVINILITVKRKTPG